MSSPVSAFHRFRKRLPNWPRDWPVKNNWVVNASPLILLAKVKHLELLLKLSNTLVIPASVVTEIKTGPADDPAGLWLDCEGAKWIQPDPPLDSADCCLGLGLRRNGGVELGCPAPRVRSHH